MRSRETMSHQLENALAEVNISWAERNKPDPPTMDNDDLYGVLVHITKGLDLIIQRLDVLIDLASCQGTTEMDSQ